MSLDVYLRAPEGDVVPRSGSGIFIRENGMCREITREEWNERYPDREPVTVNYESDYTDEIYSDNITHNLNSMAEAAGIYKHLWRPDEIEITTAAQLIEPLREGLRKLRATPDLYKRLNPANGWGNYDGLVRFVTDYLEACEANPTARVEVSR